MSHLTRFVAPMIATSEDPSMCERFLQDLKRCGWVRVVNPESRV
jgi:hypothetical protein